MSQDAPAWRRYLRFWKPDPTSDVDDEIAFHLEQRVRDLNARGLTLEEAASRAAAEFGEVDQVRGDCIAIDERVHRRATLSTRIEAVVHDMRVAIRSLAGTPAFAITAILCAALGIGVTATIMSAADVVLRRPLPYRAAEQLVAIYAENTVRGYRGVNISYPDFVDWRDRNTTFASLGMWTSDTKTIANGGDAERLQGAEITANLFSILGVNPAIGRHFSAAEERPGGPRVALLSHRLWRSRFGGDTAILGRAVQLDGHAFTVVGIMPDRFNFPERGDIWTPFVTDPAEEEHGNRMYVGAIGRLKAGVTFEQGRADLHRLSTIMAKEVGQANYGWRADVVPMREDMLGDVSAPIKVFMVGVALVLIMVCANVANLMLARAALRSREIAVRSALGASRARIAGQLLTESLVISVCGGLLGVAIAAWGTRLLRFAFPDETPPFYINLGVDGFTLAILVALTLFTAIAAGMIPALASSRVDLDRALRDGTRGSGDAGRARMRQGLVIAEVSLSIVLMVGATLLLRNYQSLATTELGFSQERILSARIALTSATYTTRAQNLAFAERLTARLQGLPGVESVGLAQGVPFSGWNVQGSLTVEGRPRATPGNEFVTHYQWVSTDYFRTIGVGLVSGRWLTEADRDTLNPVVLVNRLFAERAFPGQSPLGKRVRLDGYDDGPWNTVVGVVEDFRHYRLPQPMGPAMYMPYALNPVRSQTFVIRTASDDPETLIPALRSVVREIDPDLALYQVRPLDEVVSRSLWRQRLQGNVVGIFALLALALASLGLYGVISYAVAQRTREIGVRMALGASRTGVAVLVLRQTMGLVAIGVAIGLAAAAATTGYLESMLHGIRTSDPVSFAAVPLLLTLTAIAAVWGPARRATRIDPLVAMRSE